MFTGIIETQGSVLSITANGTNVTYTIYASFTKDLKVDQSVSHNGVCLTIENINIEASTYQVTAIKETLDKTELKDWRINSKVNLERGVLPSSRIDGHFVQGHVDTTARCKKVLDQNGSWLFTFEFDNTFAPLIIEKGSICVNGISLTAFNVKNNAFDVAIIPFTWNNTNISEVSEGIEVNIEFDMIGKYILRKLSLESDD
ncbi:MAG: riboflavin synthase [Flavipsychrobacter sp.]